MNNNLITINQYGKITIDIKTYMDEKCINRNMLARSINARFEVIDKWYNGHVEKLMRMCLPVFALYWNVLRGILSDIGNPTNR